MLHVKLIERNGNINYEKAKSLPSECSLRRCHLLSTTFLTTLSKLQSYPCWLAICGLMYNPSKETQLVSGNHLSFESNTFSPSCQIILMCPSWWKENCKYLCHPSLLQITEAGSLCLCLSSNQSCVARVKIALDEPVSHQAGPYSLTISTEIQ